jgi:hypothetical protein
MEKRMLKGFALLTMVAGSVSAVEMPKCVKNTYNGTINHRGKVSAVAFLVAAGLDVAGQKLGYFEQKAEEVKTDAEAKVSFINGLKARNTLGKISASLVALTGAVAAPVASHRAFRHFKPYRYVLSKEDAEKATVEFGKDENITKVELIQRSFKCNKAKAKLAELKKAKADAEDSE